MTVARMPNRMRENGADLWKWLEGGAHFYVCGDATRMARDVDDARSVDVERDVLVHRDTRDATGGEGGEHGTNGHASAHHGEDCTERRGQVTS